MRMHVAMNATFASRRGHIGSEFRSHTLRTLRLCVLGIPDPGGSRLTCGHDFHGRRDCSDANLLEREVSLLNTFSFRVERLLFLGLDGGEVST